jgi:hypothetical protein
MAKETVVTPNTADPIVAYLEFANGSSRPIYDDGQRDLCSLMFLRKRNLLW